jgi:hypothetical protein
MPPRDRFRRPPSNRHDGDWLNANYPELKKQLSDDYLADLVTRLLQRWHYHVQNVEKARLGFSLTGWLLVFALPIFSAFITWATSGGNWLIHGRALGLISLLLTLLTLVSSILKPLQRTTQADHQLVALYTWHYKLLCELRAQSLSHEGDLATYLTARDAELSQIGNQMVNTLTPDDSSSNRSGNQNNSDEASVSGKGQTSAPKVDG